jgi:hypothetical protein
MKAFGFIFLIVSSSATCSTDCHPPIDPELPQYIVGYGSLMDEASKQRTDPTAQKNLPVVVHGYKRSWSVHGDSPGLSMTFLSIVEDKHAFLNGAIYPLSHPSHMLKYDAREVMYCRKKLNIKQLGLYSAELPPKQEIWIYTSAQPHQQPPSREHPIVQSYVDIFLRGCIQMEDKFKIKHFAEDCVTTTEHWSEHWVNDRIFPRRPFVHEPYASKIDALLKKRQPKLFKKIKIE